MGSVRYNPFLRLRNIWTLGPFAYSYLHGASPKCTNVSKLLHHTMRLASEASSDACITMISHVRQEVAGKFVCVFANFFFFLL
jgi:hypothetical protein